MTQPTTPKKPLSDSEKREQYRIAELERQAKNGSSYFYWIAFFAVLNQVMDKFNSNRTFVFGLGIPQYVNRLIASSNPAVLWGILLVMTVIFVIFGLFAQRRNIPVYIAGIAFYLVDMVFSILSRDVVSSVMHVIFTGLLVMGLVAMKKLPAQSKGKSK